MKENSEGNENKEDNHTNNENNTANSNNLNENKQISNDFLYKNEQQNQIIDDEMKIEIIKKKFSF